MEKIDIFIDNYTPKFIKIFLDFFGLTSKDITIILLYIGVIFLIKYSFKSIVKSLKYTLYKNRKNNFLKLLYFRVEKLLRPLRYLLYTYLLSQITSILFTLKVNNIYFLLFFVNLFFLLWFVYEFVKFIIYSSIKSKIKSQKSARRELFNLLLNIAKILIGLIAILVTLSKFDVDITALITSLGIGGVIIGFSAKDVLVNFFDSIRLISEDAFRQGDWIETKEVEGFVTELGLTSTQIRTFDNAMVTIPNSQLANGYIKNWTKRLVGRRIKFKIPIKYTTNTEEIDRVVQEIYLMLRNHEDIVNLDKIKYLNKMKLTYEDGLFNLEDKYGVRKTLLVYLDEMGEYSLNILVYAFTISVNWEDWLRAKQDIIKKIILIIDKSDLEFAYPTKEILLDKH